MTVTVVHALSIHHDTISGEQETSANADIIKMSNAIMVSHIDLQIYEVVRENRKRER